MLAWMDVPVVINVLFLKYIQITTSSVTSTYFRGTGNVSSFGTLSCTRGSNVMAMDEVSLDRPEVGTGFSVICGFCRLRPLRFALNFSTEIFTACRLFPPWSGYSEFVLSSWQFCCSICDWENEFIIFLADQHFPCLDSSRVNIRCIQRFQIFQVFYQNISFPNSTRNRLISEKDSRL